jgi:D-sedoheptulose 7-phosphate isomerase
MGDTYFSDYFAKIKESLDLIDTSKLENLVSIFLEANNNNNKIMLVGNGGSATIADHLTIDFINAAGIRAVNFNDPALITCFSNDYGYENWVERALDCYANSGDVLVLISSSGQSKNMLVGARKAKSLGLDVITLTGFSSNNPLRGLGDINLWVDSNEYNIVEMTHHIWLLAAVDYIIMNNKE